MLFFIKKKIIKTTVSRIAIFDTVVLTFFNDDNLQYFTKPYPPL